MDLTATTAHLAAASADLVRLVPAKLVDPVLAGVVLTATPTGLALSATDRERSASVESPAIVHTEGRVLVPAKPLAETLRALADDRVRLVVEGSRLAIRTDTARFALPLLDIDLHPGVPTNQETAHGTVSGAHLAEALATVAGTASRDDALPLFTGVRVRAEGSALVLRATDRYRMAIATIPWTPAGEAELDALVPAALLQEIGKQVAAEPAVELRTSANSFTATWPHSTATTAILDGTFVSEANIVLSKVDTTVETDADALSAATRRVALHTNPRGVVTLEVGDTHLKVRTTPDAEGEAEEHLKATPTGGRTSPAYQSRYLVDALRPFAGGPVTLAIQPGMRATILTAPEPGEVKITYILVPIRPQS
ncbi:DNA polymerase III subunit beta [Actinokineospora sp. G85]|uniref:DNA polymerase III subunit beta n=1 Tax=Actinokineospora sp. G85 TaxID=3406626 RepID=UPI003C74ECB4